MIRSAYENLQKFHATHFFGLSLALIANKLTCSILCISSNYAVAHSSINANNHSVKLKIKIKTFFHPKKEETSWIFFVSSVYLFDCKLRFLLQSSLQYYEIRLFTSVFLLCKIGYGSSVILNGSVFVEWGLQKFNWSWELHQFNRIRAESRLY